MGNDGRDIKWADYCVLWKLDLTVLKKVFEENAFLKQVQRLFLSNAIDIKLNTSKVSIGEKDHILYKSSPLLLVLTFLPLSIS